MRTPCFLIAILASLTLGGCVAGGTLGMPNGSQDVATSTRSVGHFIVMQATRQANCPSQYVTCVTVSRHVSSPSVYFCYSPGSYCGPSQPQYGWSGFFYVSKTGNPTDKFGSSFNPDPGNPTYDTIYERKKVRSSHGKVKYQQAVCPLDSGSGCVAGPFLVGIITQ